MKNRGEDTMRTSVKSLLLITAAVCMFLVSGQSAVAASPQPAPPQSVAAPQQSYSQIVDRVAPAVVTIRSARRIRAPQQFPFSDDPFFGQFFGERYQNAPRQDRPRSRQSQRPLTLP